MLLKVYECLAKKKILVVAGEISGDNHGSKLIKSLKNKDDNVTVSAVGGSKMKEICDNFEENVVNKAATGFTEVIKQIPYFFKLKNRLKRKYFAKDSEHQIDALVVIDFPGFNVRLAKVAYRLNIPVFYYITPQVWAWGKRRIKLLSKICRKLFCVFKFEKEIFDKKGGNAEFVGHPLLEDIPEKNDLEVLDMTSGKDLVAVLPGSRVNEVKKHLPVIKKALTGTKVQPVVGRSDSVPRDLIDEIYPGVRQTENVYGLMSQATIGIISSGTSNLEAAHLGLPFITVYSISAISYLMAKYLVDIDYISMVNILAEKEVVTELIQHSFTPGRLKKEVLFLINNARKREKMKEEFKKIDKKLGRGETSREVAESVIEIIRGEKI
ncbi:MAG: lipid-A-disaccharide synthase [Elusimicrobiota bacterium]